MYVIKIKNSIDKSPYRITRNKQVCLEDDDNDVIYHGKNDHGQNVLGIINCEDDRNNLTRYLHVILTNESLNSFLDGNISFLEILQNSENFCVFDFNYQKEEMYGGIILFDDLPEEFRPLANSYFKK